MAQYKVLKPLLKSSEKKTYNPGETVDLTDEEARGALSFRAVVPAPDSQATTPSKSAQDNATTSQPNQTKQAPTDKTASDAK